MVDVTSLPWIAALGPVGLTLWRVNGGTLASPNLDKLLNRVELAGAIGLVVGLVALAGQGVVNPAAWDFPAFYTVGSQAAKGGSFYDPTELASSFEGWRHGVGVDGDWLNEIGYWYAPPTTFLLAPFGFLGFRTALTLHHVVQLAFLAGAVWRLHSILPLGQRRLDIARMVVLLVAFRPVGSAVLLGQIVFGALFFEAWAYSRATDDTAVGWLLGLGALFKHLLIIPAVLLALVGRWRLLAMTTLTLTAACAAAAVVFGPSAFVEFVEFGPGERDPEIAIYGVVQSLNAELRRWFNDVPSSPGATAAILYVPYLLAAGAATVVTLWAMIRVRGQQCGPIVQLALASTLAVLAYPNTLFNTLPLLLPAVFVLLSPTTGFHNRSARERLLIISIVGLSYALPALLFSGGFYAIVLLWAALVILSLARQWPADPIQPTSQPGQRQETTRVILPSGAVRVLTWPTVSGTVFYKRLAASSWVTEEKTMNSFVAESFAAFRQKLFPEGQRRKHRLLVLTLLALPAAVVFASTPASAIQTCTDGAMVIVAHQDDDTLFANPDIIDEVDSGGCVTAVYITAGNANRGIEYWDLREVGAQAAYATMAGVASNWTEEELTLANGAQVVSRSLVGKPQISLVFMRLPDNGPDETQLEDLWDNTRTSVSSLDGRASHTRAGLIETLTELMTLRQPDVILTHEFDGNFGGGDHSDHYAAGFFVNAAHDNYQRLHTIYGYEGYGIVNRPANVSGTALTDSHSAFFAYAAWDNRVCNDAVACAASDPQILTWLARQYIVSTDTGGTAQLGVLDVSATAVDFGRVEIGNTETRSIVVQNTGNGELTGVTLPALSAPLRWVNPGALGSTLAVDASVTLEIEYDTASTEPAAFSGFIRTNQGSSPLAITGVAGRSGYALTDQISRIYTAAFLRAPQADGLAYWVGQRAGGRSLASIAQAFTTSPEFMDRYGTLSDAEFVDRVYENVLNRDPDPNGEAFWLDELAGDKTRGDMLVGFSESPEFVDETGTTLPPRTGDGPVLRLYQAYFGRAPQQPALDYWVSSGRSLTSISDFFAQSPEFVATYGELDNKAFIALVYRNVLDRASDPGGEAYWLDQLSTGTTRGGVMTGFSESPEYITATETLPR